MCGDSGKYCMLAVSTFVLYAVAITMVVVGTLNIYDVLPGCPAQEKLPHLNIAGGTIIMAGLFIRELIKRLCECCYDCCDYDRCCRIGGKVLKCSLTMIYDLCFMLVSLFWLILTSTSVYRVLQQTIKFEDLSDEITMALDHLNNFTDKVVDALSIDGLAKEKAELAADFQEGVSCDEILYYVTIVVVAAGWIVLALGVLYFIFFKFCRHVICCKTCREERPPPHHVYASV